MVLLVCLGMFAFAIALGYMFPLKPRVTWSEEVLDRKGKLMHAFLTPDHKWRLKTRLQQADCLYLAMLLQKEDQYFFAHPGINPLAIVRAGFQNVLGGKRVSGASTITMQVARMLSRRPRTYTSKIAEIWEALRLEGGHSKAEILELYISLCPFGGNIEGYRSATMLFWNTDGKRLSAAQCAVLCLIPNHPQRFHPVRQPLALKKARNSWLQAFAKQGISFPVNESLLEPVDARFYPMPQHGWQLANRLRRLHPESSSWQTSIDRTLQQQVENLSKTYVQKLMPYNIHNAAVLVVENKTGHVRVYMPSHDFANSPAGQMDGIKAIRSPGSTLKPFLYARMMDEGKLIPDQILYDVPRHFAGFAPENSDYTFHGKVPATDALLQSYNVPAVYLLDQFGTQPFLDYLGLLGFQSLESQKPRLGYSLVLGGCGVKLEELAGAYAMLANGGFKTPLQYLESDSLQPKERLLSAGSAWLAGDMLAGWRRNYTAKTQQEKAMNQVSWKTGTSFGKKDAWSMGFNQQYTVGVWLGNFDGSASAAITGTEIATPLMLQVFNLLPKSNEKQTIPAALSKRTLCVQTGLPADTFCHETLSGYWLSQTNLQRCTHKIQVITDMHQRNVYCNSCKRPGEPYQTIWVPNPDPAYLQFLHGQNLQMPKVQAHAPHCPLLGAGAPSHITSPVEGKMYVLDGLTYNGLPLQIEAGATVKKVYWYLNETLIHKGSPQQLFSINPPAGKHKVSFADDKGNTGFVHFYVKRVEPDH